jgi:nicotinamidase/pyrazinamidase
MGKIALLIIDIQNDFCPPNGSLAVPDGLEIISGINYLRSRVNFDLIVHTQDWHPVDHISFGANNPGSTLLSLHRIPSGELQTMWPVHCVQGYEGAEFHPNLLVKETDVVVRKGMNSEVDSYSGFFDNDHKVQTEMHSVLQANGIDTVVVVGLAFDYCVGSSALDAVGLGYTVYLIKELTRSVDEDSENSMLAKLQDANVRLIKAMDIEEDGMIIPNSQPKNSKIAKLQ